MKKNRDTLQLENFAGIFEHWRHQSFAIQDDAQHQPIRIGSVFLILQALGG